MFQEEMNKSREAENEADRRLVECEATVRKMYEDAEARRLASLEDAKKAYDTLFDNVGKGYFESNALIVIYRAASSSGDTFKVSSITTAGDTLTVGITQTEGGVTEDMSGWLFVVPVHKTALQNITTYAAE